MKNNYSKLLLVCSLMSGVVTAGALDEAPLGESVERHLPGDEAVHTWAIDPNVLKQEAGDRLEVQEVPAEKIEIIKLQNVVPAIHFESGVADIPKSYIDSLRKVLDSMRERRNVRLHLIGHADDQQLSATLARVFGDNEGLSRERAGQVAEFLQTRLGLPPEAVTYEWAGDKHPIASNATAEGRAKNRRVEVEVWYDEVKPTTAQQEVLVKEDFKRVKVCRMDTVCKMRFKEGQSRRTRVRNLVPSLHYDSDTVTVPTQFTEQIQKAFTNLADKQNVVVKFIGYTDDQPLTGRNERIYGTQLALSKARAQRVALAVQEALKLPAAAIAIEGRGVTRAVAANDTEQGRALNRRVEVEFWHDDPLQELPEEPQLCPDGATSEVVTKVYIPPWGTIAPLQLDAGRAVIPGGYTENLRRAMDDIADRKNVRLRFVGYTKNERLDRRTALIYGDDIGLATSRARRAMETIRDQMKLSPAQAEHEGRGYLSSEDVVNEGFVQGETSYVAVQVVYDEPAVLDDYEGVDITRLTRELTPKNPYSLNMMRITVDGKPLDDPNRSSADVQRCTDVALEEANIQLQFDNLQSKRRLSISASPTTFAVRKPTAEEIDALSHEGEPAEELDAPASWEPWSEELMEEAPEGVDENDPTAALQDLEKAQAAAAYIVQFRMYSNYAAYIDRAEVRVFEQGQSLQAEPIGIAPVDADGFAEWQPPFEEAAAPSHELKYVLRVYDRNGNFDETSPQPLWLKNEEPHESAAQLDENQAGQDAELLDNYGENQLALRNIPVGSGTVRVHGDKVPSGHSVWVAGRQIPVDANGNFVAEEILPDGQHTVEVAVLDDNGDGMLYLRDLDFKRSDWFYMGLADVTASKNSTTGPAELLQGENSTSNFDSSLYGRLAFFTSGKFWDNWSLTASADTREEPFKDMFSNFLNKSPDSLFRRIDPDYHYPTFGDDSVVEEMAPTQGKFYVKMKHKEDHALWGNFKVSYLENELAHVDRGLYGANVHYQTDGTTSFGEQRLKLDGFAAEPGTLASREEFRGTGGSLYFLRNQDILTGSESVRVEIRDKDSGLVTATKNLQPGLDYDIDYLQGRILLGQPLSSTADDSLLIRSDGLSGDLTYLVVRYEYTPGFEDLNAMATGGEGHYWLNDYFKVGLTTSRSDLDSGDSSLNGADATFRVTSDSWLKIQGAKSEGLVSNSLYSDDGGFGFSSFNATSFDSASAGAMRADLSVGLSDVFKSTPGRLTLYTQTQDAGYSAPGLGALTDTETVGGTFNTELNDKLSLKAKADKREQDQGISANTQELDANYELTERWSVSSGVKKDDREYTGPVVLVNRPQGERTDGVLQVTYDSKTTWRAYVFGQDTLSKSDQREANNRAGLGGSYRFTDRFRADAEVSDGNLGAGGRLGTNYLVSERTSLYLNYALENEQAYTGFTGRRGNLISGMKRRFADASSVYVEERYQDTDASSGLTHATGVTLVPNARWNIGANVDVGTLTDDNTGGKIDRKAGGVRVGYTFNAVQFSSGVEYRIDENMLLDQSLSERKTWLLRNNFKLQLSPDWRMLGKFNHAQSDSSLGQFYDGGYTEGVIGYAYRPVANDRLNALAKYTYFYNVPTTEQLGSQNVAAQFIQKSHIAAVDATYDVNRRWSIGGKYAYRLGQVSLDRENPQFFDNRAQLYILRNDLRFGQHWEVLIEGRLLDMVDLNEQRSGALLGLYRYLGKHIKVGAGYNFTDFSDDLKDLSFRHRGVFINIIGTI